MKVTHKQVERSLISKLYRYILNKPNEGIHGLLSFGKENNYPQLFENLINNSTTATGIVRLITNMIIGEGFQNENLNKVVVGKSPQGKDVTLLEYAKQIAQSITIHQGYYTHSDYTVGTNTKDGKSFGIATGDTHVLPFKDCRFPKKDDTGYTAKVLVYDNWAKETEENISYKDVKAYDVFNQNETVLKSKFNELKEKGEKYKGQVFFSFQDYRYNYPLNTFDSAYLHLDTEYHLGLFQNNEIRNGFTGKTVARFAPSTDPDSDIAAKEDEATSSDFAYLLGSDGAKFIVVKDEELSNNGEVKEKSRAIFENIKSSIEADLFESYDAKVFESIRLAGWNVPKILLNPDASLFGASGESLVVAFSILNATLRPVVRSIEQDLVQIFAMTNKEELKNESEFKLKPLGLDKFLNNGITTDTATAE